MHKNSIFVLMLLYSILEMNMTNDLAEGTFDCINYGAVAKYIF
jgi:hypothetical protein